jgi:hypothetical protein
MSETSPPPARRSYCSARSGRRPARACLTLDRLKQFLKGTFEDLEAKGYLQEGFGYHCVDSGFSPGRAGSSPEQYALRKTRATSLWPLDETLPKMTEDDLFDEIEFLFDYSSEGIDGSHHQFCDCGWHYNGFDRKRGQTFYQAIVNDLLADYGQGHELSEDGEILSVGDEAFAPSSRASLPGVHRLNVQQRVEEAKAKYRRRGSTLSDRRDADRDLADVLEFVREDARKVLNSKDSGHLFNLANNFGIRHHNKDRKTDYDPAIWLSWMFYYYLATIHACIRLIERTNEGRWLAMTRRGFFAVTPIVDAVNSVQIGCRHCRGSRSRDG